MRILFTADWHIKLGQKNVPKDWAINRYRMLFNSINKEIKKEIDLLIIGGDIFDRTPSLQELSLFLEFISTVTVETIIYDGNHEATRRGHTFLTLLKDTVQVLNSKVTILEGIQSIHNIDFIPYTDLKTFNENNFHNKILCTHVRGSIAPHVVPEIDLNKLKGWEVVLAGDLHAYANSQRNILYPGSPLSTSFHRNSITNGAILFDTGSMQHNFIEFGLPQLLRKTVETEEEMIAGDYNHIIYELVGNTIDVANVENELLDKKIIEKNTEATLNLANKSIEEELHIYLKEIIVLNEKQINNVMEVFNDYA